MTVALAASRSTYVGLFVIALTTLMYEILLTRIFSVTMWYHFAFVAISVAMFGLTVGALIVYLMPGAFPPEGSRHQLAASAVAFPVLMVLSLLTQLSIPFQVHASIVGIYSIALTYVVVSVPFIASGICICLALTRFPSQISQLYAADLLAAATGCLAIIAVLNTTDGPTAVLVVAFIASLGGVCFSVDAGSQRLKRLGQVTAVVLGLAAAGHMVLVWHEFPVLRILYTKGGFEPRPLYEKWNSYSRVQVSGDMSATQRPFWRTLSPSFPQDRTVRELRMDIDVAASTSVTGYSGKPEEIEHLKYDVTAVGHYVRPPHSVLVVGTGGGRDILAALATGAKSITGVELNRDIIRTVNGRFGDYTGHLDRIAGVRFVNGEARSYIAARRDQYDFIQISLIDTWAATAAGAFVLSENSLYTVEAWDIFLRHLTDRGVLSVSRWYMENSPGEVYRTVTLATAALQSIGVANPRDHMLLVRSRPLGPATMRIGVGTLLVSRTPFSSLDVDRFDAAVSRLQFEPMLSPRVAADDVLAHLASGRDLEAFIASFPLNIAPPTDDSPFFFHMLRLKDILRPHLIDGGKSAPNLVAVVVLGALLATVVVLCVACVAVPLALTGDREVLAGKAPLLLFFSAIGLGFMLIETSQMQRLIIVLGHPTYALSVVLTTVLLSSGIGSYLTTGIGANDAPERGLRRIALLVAGLIVMGLVTPSLTRHFESATDPTRIIVSVALLAPVGLLMGMLFPIGMKLAGPQAERLTPWLWGLNGAFSVCATVLSIVIALAAGISAAFWTGVGAYVVALWAFQRASRPTARLSHAVPPAPSV